MTAAADQQTAAGAFRTLLPHNADAMLIAELPDLPTVNGFASFNPPDWNFGAPDAKGYEMRVRAYLVRHDLTQVCRLDLKAMSWTAGLT